MNELDKFYDSVKKLFYTIRFIYNLHFRVYMLQLVRIRMIKNSQLIVSLIKDQ